MKTITIRMGILLLGCCSALVAQQMPKPEPPRTLTQVMDRALSNAEKEFMSAVEVMPEDKYGYVPTDGEFKGVRTFAGQIKHVAASNYEFGGAILQEKPPVDFGGEEGPASIKTKAEIVSVLERFVRLHAQGRRQHERKERHRVSEEPMGTEHHHTSGSYYADGSPYFRSLRPDGGVFAAQRDRAAHEQVKPDLCSLSG